MKTLAAGRRWYPESAPVPPADRLKPLVAARTGQHVVPATRVHDRAKVVRAYLAEHPAIETEPFPGYAPEANPDEGVWQHVKHGRLANFAAGDTAEPRAVLVKELDRLHRRPKLSASFIRHAEIPIRLRL